MEPRRFRASLSGSGSRLGWHVGVLKGYLEDLKWQCTEYRGSSGGGLVAVAAACGKLAWLETFLSTLVTAGVYRSAGLWGLWKGYRYSIDPLELQMKAQGVPDWEVLVPVRLSLYDLQAQSPYSHLINPGQRLRDHWAAVLGTMAIPGIFPPTNHGRWVDGCVTEAIPDIGNIVALTEHPWVVSVAMAAKLVALTAPPSNVKDILKGALAGLVAEVVRTDLKWAATTPLRVHVLPHPEWYDSMEFDPETTAALIKLGWEDVIFQKFQSRKVTA